MAQVLAAWRTRGVRPFRSALLIIQRLVFKSLPRFPIVESWIRFPAAVLNRIDADFVCGVFLFPSEHYHNHYLFFLSLILSVRVARQGKPFIP